MSGSFVASNTAETSATTGITVPMPAGLKRGDVVVAVVAHGSTANQTFSEAGGTWTPVADLYGNSTRDSNCGVFLKQMGDTPDTNVTINTTGGSFNHVGLTYGLRGIDLTTPQDVAATTTTATNTGNINSLAIVPVTDGAIALTLGASGALIASLSITAPAGYSNMVTKVHSTSNISVACAMKTVSPAASENAANYVFSTSDASSSYAAVAMALRPGASISVTPASADAATGDVDPTVKLGSVSVAPAAAAAATAVVNPTVLVSMGSISVTPSPAAAATSVVAPTVGMSSLTVSPAAAQAACAVVDPTVRHGSLSIAPGAAVAATGVGNPTVRILSSELIAPAAAEARCEASIEAIEIGLGWKFGTEVPLSQPWTPQDKPAYSPYV